MYQSKSWSELKDNQPFYAQINFPETHRGRSWNQAHRHIPAMADPNEVEIPPYYPDHPVTRAVWAQYLNAIMALDDKVGFVLQLLKRDGLDTNTEFVWIPGASVEYFMVADQGTSGVLGPVGHFGR